MDGPLTLNELNDVLLTTVSIIDVVPPTFKFPLIFTVFKLDVPDTFNDDNNVVLFDSVESPDINKLLKLILLNIVFDVDCKFDINDINDVDVDCKLFKDNDVYSFYFSASQ
jgi:hypothetical protein